MTSRPYYKDLAQLMQNLQHQDVNPSSNREGFCLLNEASLQSETGSNQKEKLGRLSAIN